MKEELKHKHADLVGRIEDTKDLSKEDEAKLKEVLVAFKKNSSF